MGRLDRLSAVPAAEKWMDHPACDRTWADDGNSDDKIVPRARTKPWKHRHLRPALDLKCPDGVRLLDHRERGTIVGGNGVQPQFDPAMATQQTEAPIEQRQSPQTQ